MNGILKKDRWTGTAFKDLVLLVISFAGLSILVHLYGAFESFQEWMQEQPVWREWRIHDFLVVINILGLGLGVFAIRRWRELGREILERKRVDEALRESEERFTAFMDNSPAVAWIKDPVTWTFRYINDAFENVFNITREQISSKTDFDLWPEEIARQLRDNDLSVMSLQKTIQTSEDVPLPDGTLHHWLVFKFPLQMRSGEFFLAGTAVDITQRKRAEEALRASEERFRSVNQSAIDGIIVADGNGAIISWNKAAQTIFGYSEEEALGKPLTFLMPERFHTSHNRGMEHFLSTGNSKVMGKTLEHPGRRKDGTEFPLELSLTSWKSNEETYFTGIVRDITDRKRAVEKITMLGFALRSISDCVSITDKEDNILFVNDAFLRTYGYEEHELLGKHINIVRSEKNSPEEVHDILPATIGGGWRGEVWNRRKDGGEFLVSISTAAVTEDNGEAIALIGVARDITERKKAEEERTRMIRELQDALGKVKMLSGLLPICASCKKIRDERGAWQVLEGYIHEHSDARFSHGVCPECAKVFFPEAFGSQ